MASTVTDGDPVVDIIIEEKVRERARAKKWGVIKAIVFFSLLVLYIKLYVFDGYSKYFEVPTEATYVGHKEVGGLFVAFIAGALFIWLPDRIINAYQSFFRMQNRSALSVPPIAFRIFGWVIFLAPAVVLLIQYFS